jgi:hypothetical protein
MHMIVIADTMVGMKISVEITPGQKQQLEEMARQFGIAAEQLASAALQDLLTHDQAEFEAIVSHILQKNRELYKRLS